MLKPTLQDPQASQGLQSNAAQASSTGMPNLHHTALNPHSGQDASDPPGPNMGTKLPSSSWVLSGVNVYMLCLHVELCVSSSTVTWSAVLQHGDRLALSFIVLLSLNCCA